VLQERGIAGITMGEIAERLGMTKGTLYYYFEDKDDLLYQCHMRCLEVSLRALRDEDLPAGSGEIYGLYLDPERTGRGLGAALLAYALADLRARDFGEIAVWPFEENERALRLYERSGFRRDGARREWTQEGASAVEVRLRLAPETGVDTGFTPPRPPA